ncbi:MAG: hypothetical protein OXL96_21310 [Candidatus Poribacteria bacterium]|nr:hypothetical protein [Candidatus Poribacteria bacterium]
MTRRIPVLSIVLVCILSFSLFGCTEADDPVEEIFIPDAQLHREIRRNLNFPNDTPITVVTMRALTELNAKFISLPLIEIFVVLAGGEFDEPISDLTGLEYAEHLVVLNLSDNNIVDVNPLAELKT